MSTHVIGTPGKYSASLGRANTVRALGWDAVALVAGLAAAAATIFALIAFMGGRTPVLEGLIAVAAGVAAVLWAPKGQAASASAGRQRRGAQAEVDVVAALRRSRVALVINGAELHAGGDADHVVAHLRGAGRGVLAAIETKAGGGSVKMKGHSLVTGRAERAIPGDPVAQVRRQAGALAKLGGRSVVAIVCIPAMTNQHPFVVGDVVVCGTKHLPDLFARGLPSGPLTDSDVDRLARNVVPKD